MEITPQWEVTFEPDDYQDDVTWIVNGKKQLIELIEIFAWNYISDFKVKRTNG